jgi:hypothetical protein
MTTRPITSPLFATDATLDGPAGLDAGLPPRVDPGPGTRAQGFYPKQMPVRWMNFVLGLHGDWIEYLDDVQAISALKTWSRHEPAFSSSESINYLVAVRKNSTHAVRAIVALGGASDNDYWFLRSPGTGVFEPAVVDGSPTNQPTCAAAGAIGEFMFVPNGGGVLRRLPSLGTAAAIDTDFFSDVPTAIHYATFCSKYFVATTSGFIFEGATPGSGSSVFVATSITAGAAQNAGGEFADDGTANIVLACKCVIGGVDRFRIFRSGDAGTSWTVAHAAGAGVTALNVVWSTAHNCFVALDSAGEIFTSADGSGFASVRVTAITAAAGAGIKHGTLASQGTCLVKAFAPALYGSNHAGVAYSFDLGATWRVWALSETFTASSIVPLSVLGTNGRFYVAMGNKIYTSGCVLSEDADYT